MIHTMDALVARLTAEIQKERAEWFQPAPHDPGENGRIVLVEKDGVQSEVVYVRAELHRRMSDGASHSFDDLLRNTIDGVQARMQGGDARVYELRISAGFHMHPLPRISYAYMYFSIEFTLELTFLRHSVLDENDMYHFSTYPTKFDYDTMCDEDDTF